ncbi:MAG: DNA primase [Deltaproteobacteria bacterium]|nr:DNA primase [Deltaproteobacteria bacterium]
MRIPSEKLDEVRSRVNLVEIVSDYVTLKRSGARHVGLCPFHQEKTPSFSVNEEKGVFYCFGCGVGGNAFSFLTQLKGLSFVAAVEELARRVGVQLQVAAPSTSQKEKERLYRVNLWASDFYRKALQGPDGQTARDYLHQRGIREEAVEQFRLGYARSGWETLSAAAAAQGFSPPLLEAVGLVIPRERGGGCYDRFRHRLMFPIVDPSGHVLAFGGRVLSSEDQPKYLNSPESLLFSKGRTFYGLHATQSAIAKQRYVIIVEGYLDLISLWQAGLPNVVATLGTALTPFHMEALRRYTDQIVLLFDGDAAGKRAAWRSLEPFLKASLFPKMVFLPDGEDPDQHVQKRGTPFLLEQISKAPFLLDVVMDEGFREAGQGIPDRARWLEGMLPILASIEDPLARGLYLQRVTDRTGLPLAVLEERLSRVRRTQNQSQPSKPIEVEGLPVVERLAVQAMIRYPQWVLEKEMGWVDHLVHSGLQKIARVFLEQNRSSQNVDLAGFMEKLPDSSIQGLFSRLILEEESMSEPEWKQAFEEAILKIRKRGMKEEQQRLSQRLQEAQRSGNDTLLRQLLETKVALKHKEQQLAIRH